MSTFFTEFNFPYGYGRGTFPPTRVALSIEYFSWSKKRIIFFSIQFFLYQYNTQYTEMSVIEYQFIITFIKAQFKDGN